MGTISKNCGRGNQNITGNKPFVVLILFILMAIIVGGRFFY